MDGVEEEKVQPSGLFWSTPQGEIKMEDDGRVVERESFGIRWNSRGLTATA